MFLEDINNLLNSGEVPNIFGADEKGEICEKMRQFDKQQDKSIQVRFFINCVHINDFKQTVEVHILTIRWQTCNSYLCIMNALIH
jgi:hypothetical protein